MRAKIPFGIANIGKSFRNEITPGQFIFRTREFEQMEIEFFCDESEEDKWFDYWVENRLNWYKNLGIPEKKLRIRNHEKSELAHYAKKTSDIEFEYPWGWGELEGIANRGNFDLNAHQESSGKDLERTALYRTAHQWQRTAPHRTREHLQASFSSGPLGNP